MAALLLLASVLLALSPAGAADSPLNLDAWSGSLDEGTVSLVFSAPVKEGSLRPHRFLLGMADGDSLPLGEATQDNSSATECGSHSLASPMPVADASQITLLLSRTVLFRLRASLFTRTAPPDAVPFTLLPLPNAAAGIDNQGLSVPAMPLSATLSADLLPPAVASFSFVADVTRAGALRLELMMKEPSLPWAPARTADIDGVEVCVQMLLTANRTCLALQFENAVHAAETVDDALSAALRLRLQTDLTEASASQLKAAYVNAGLGGGSGDDELGLAAARAAATSLTIPANLLSDTSGNVRTTPSLLAPARSVALRVPGPRLQQAIFDLQQSQLALVFDLPVRASSFQPALLLLMDAGLRGSPLALAGNLAASPAPAPDPRDASGRTLLLALSGSLRALLAPLLAQGGTGSVASTPPASSTSVPPSSSSTSTTSVEDTAPPTTASTVSSSVPATASPPGLPSAPASFSMLLRASGITSSQGLGVTSQEDVTLAANSSMAAPWPPIAILPDATPPKLMQASVDLDSGLLELTLSEPVIPGRVRPNKLSVFLIPPGETPTQLPLRTAGGVVPAPSGADALALALPLATETLDALRASLLDAGGALRQESLPLQVGSGFVQDFERNSNVLAVVQLRLAADTGILGPSVLGARLRREPSSDAEGGVDLLLGLTFSTPIASASLRPEAMRVRIARTGTGVDSGIFSLVEAPVIRASGNTAQLDVTGLSAVLYDAQAAASIGIVQSVLFQALPAGLGANTSPAFLDRQGRGNVFSQLLLDMTDADLLPPTLTSLTLSLPSATVKVQFSEEVLLATWLGARLDVYWDTATAEGAESDKGPFRRSANFTLDAAVLGDGASGNAAVSMAELVLPPGVAEELLDFFPTRAWLTVQGSSLADKSGNIMRQYNGQLTVVRNNVDIGPRLVRFDLLSSAKLALVFSVAVRVPSFQTDAIALQSGRNSTRHAVSAPFVLYPGAAYLPLGGHVEAVEAVNATVRLLVVGERGGWGGEKGGK